MSSLLDLDYQLFTVYNFDNKIRLGSPSDGGYVIGELNVNYDCYISCGIAEADGFTVDFLNKYKLNVENCYGYDGTIQKFPADLTNIIQCIKKNIGSTNNENTTNLRELTQIYNNIFLKMDIEGSEWEWLSVMGENDLKNISQMVIELHGITNNTWHKNFDYNSFNTTIDEKINVLKKINQTHYLIHAHGNNYDKTVNGIPNVIELTYVNKKFFDEVPALNQTPLPNENLDFRNEKNQNDIDLNFIPFVNKTNPFLISVETKLEYNKEDYVKIQQKLNERNVDDIIEKMYTDKNAFYSLYDFKQRISRGLKQTLIDELHDTPIKNLYKIGKYETNKNCIICCTPFKNNADNSRYISSNKILNSLINVGYDGHFYLWNGGFPNPTGKEMKYAGVPYSFKIFLMLEAYKLGFTNVMWIDSSCHAVNNPNELFEIISKNNILLNTKIGNNNYDAMTFEKTMHLLNRLTKNDLRNAAYIETIVFGLNMECEAVQQLINDYYNMVELGWPFFSIFPEEIVLSALFNKCCYKSLLDKNDNVIKHKLYIHEKYICEEDAKTKGYYFHHKNYISSNENIHPFSFYIPDECIVNEIPKKTRLLASIIPGDLKTYTFKNKEREYNEMYQQSRFGLTKKKGGWDCLRHYEILMNGCIPLFENLEKCPKYTLTTYPKHLNDEAYELYLNWVENEEYINKYNNLCKKFIKHTKQYCSITAQIEYFFKAFNEVPQIKNILMFTCHSGINYNREPLWIGIKRYCKNINGIAVEYEKNPYIYNDTDNYEHFAYTKRIPNNDYINMSKEEIIEKINSKFWDLIIYGKVGPDEYCDFPCFDIVKKTYNKEQIAFIFGGDEIFDLTQNNKNNHQLNMHGVYIPYQPYIDYLNHFKQFGKCFVRELNM